MSKSIFPRGAIALSCVFAFQQSIAGPLTSAEVTKVINRVAVVDPTKGQQPAKIRDVIKDDLGLQTGEKSRSELLFQDNTLTRIGAETFFSFKTGTRDMTLEKGSMLLQVPKGLGGATIHTAAVTAAITGTTIMMEYVPNRYIKVLVLEGSLRLSRNGRFGDSLLLRPGKMVIMRPDAKRIPEPVDVDIKHIVQTSTLVNFPDSAPLPSVGLIQEAIDSQARSMARNDLVPTNLVMGHGTDVVLATNDQLARIAALTPTPVNTNSSATAAAPTTMATSATTSPTNVVALLPAEPAPAVVDPAGTISGVSAGAATTISPAVSAALLTSPSSTVNSLLPALPTTLDNLTNTVSSVSVVSSVTGTVVALPSALVPLTSTITSPVLNTVSAVPGTLDSLTAVVSSLPVVNTATAPVSSLSGTLNSVTSAVAPSSLINSIAGVTETTVPMSNANSSTNTILTSSTNTITNILSSTTTSASPMTTTAIAAPTPQPVSVTSSTQLVSLLSNAAPTTTGRITVSPTSLTSISQTGTTSGATTAVATSTPPPITTITSGATSTLTTVTPLPSPATTTTTTTATSVPITTTVTSLLGRH
ncbi:MAG: FecR domain-containing protein [Chthoniobacterales bacterium]